MYNLQGVFALSLLFSGEVESDSFATLWTPVPQAPLSMGFSRQEDWSGLSFPSPGDLPGSPALQADSLLLRHQGSLTSSCIVPS